MLPQNGNMEFFLPFIENAMNHYTSIQLKNNLIESVLELEQLSSNEIENYF